MPWAWCATWSPWPPTRSCARPTTPSQPEVSAFYSGIPLNAGPVAGRSRPSPPPPKAARLAGERRRFLHKTIDTFRRHGADLDAGRQEAAGGDRRRADHGSPPSSPRTCWIPPTPSSWSITDEARLAGLPPSAVAAARAERRAQRAATGWRFTLQAPRLLGGDDLPGRRRRSAAQVYQRLQRARHRGRLRQPPADRAHSGTARARRRACWASPTSPTWCWKTAWPTPARARWRSWRI